MELIKLLFSKIKQVSICGLRGQEIKGKMEFQPFELHVFKDNEAKISLFQDGFDWCILLLVMVDPQKKAFGISLMKFA